MAMPCEPGTVIPVSEIVDYINENAVPGDPGPTGATGPQGDDGAKGDQGDQGIQGIQGDQGLKGDDGLDGTDGTSVTIVGSDTIENILLKPGEVGDMWISTNDGLDGAGAAVTTGDGIIYDEDNLYWITVGPIQGPKGDDGIQGETGSAGADGLDGSKGDTGDQGIQGVQGEQGIQGEPGLDGDDGAIGPAGPSTPSVDADNELTTGSDTLLYYTDPEVTFAGLGSRGYVPDPISENDYVLHDDGTWKLQAVSPIGGTSLSYTWDGDVTATAPDEGDIKANNADQTLATELYVSDTSRLGNDVGIFWESQDVGDYIGMWEEGNQGSESDYYLVIGDVVDNGTWYTIPVEFVAGTGGIDNNRRVTAFFIDNPKNQLPSGGTIDQVLAKQTTNDYETYWRTVTDGVDGVDGAKGDKGDTGDDGAIGPEGPTAVSADVDNTAILGTDSLIYVPANGGGLPSGGTTNQGLLKASNTDGDVVWGAVVNTVASNDGIDHTFSPIGRLTLSLNLNELTTRTSYLGSDYFIMRDSQDSKITVNNMSTVLESLNGWEDGSTIRTDLLADMIGVDQTWQNVGGSRTTGVLYTNNTGKPIEVAARCLSDAASGYSVAQLFVDNQIVSVVGGKDGNHYTTAVAIVPNGSTYKIDVYDTSVVESWHELRS